jgi:hypothetical protein
MFRNRQPAAHDEVGIIRSPKQPHKSYLLQRSVKWHVFMTHHILYRFCAEEKERGDIEKKVEIEENV